MDLARQWLAQRFRQVRPARPASAVVMVREGTDGPEVLLRHRTGNTPLGRVGLPGGSLSTSDAETCRWFGPEPARWSACLGIPDRRRARQHVVAAVRELFEETGVLLAGRSDGDIVLQPRGRSWGGTRASLEQGEAGLPSLLDSRGLGLRADLLRPLERWQCALHSHRRFDTVVFAAALPPQQTASEAAAGASERGWCSARRILEGPVALPGPEGWLGEAGTVRLDQVSTPMTQALLRRVAAHRTAAAFLLSLTEGVGRGAIPQRTVVTEPDDGSGRLWMHAEETGRH